MSERKRMTSQTRKGRRGSKKTYSSYYVTCRGSAPRQYFFISVSLEVPLLALGRRKQYLQSITIISGVQIPDKYTLRGFRGIPLIGVLGGTAPSNTISLKGYSIRIEKIYLKTLITPVSIRVYEFLFVVVFYVICSSFLRNLQLTWYFVCSNIYTTLIKKNEV